MNMTMVSMHDAALEYAERGFRVFPCEVGGKRPLAAAAPHGCKDATTDADQIRRWWARFPMANIGIHAGDDLIILDLDLKDGKDGVADLQRWTGQPLDVFCSDGGGVPRVITPTGGLHLYFRRPPGTQYKSTTGLGETGGIDVRTGNAYVLAPPSVITGIGKYRTYQTETTE